MLMYYDNEFKTKEIKILTKHKIEPQHMHIFNVKSSELLFFLQSSVAPGNIQCFTKGAGGEVSKSNGLRESIKSAS